MRESDRPYHSDADWGEGIGKGDGVLAPSAGDFLDAGGFDGDCHPPFSIGERLFPFAFEVRNWAREESNQRPTLERRDPASVGALAETLS